MGSPEALKIPQERNFNTLLEQRQISANTLLCVGLDSDLSKVPVQQASIRERLRQFNASIIEATSDLVCAYKPNIAFYEEHGTEGLDALRWTIDYIKGHYGDIPIILDAKRTDIGNTNLPYARMAFDLMGADATTVNPYFGGEAIQPFLDRKDKGIVVLCRTSNPGAKDFQDQTVKHPQLGEVPLYQTVAYQAAHEWNKNGNVSLVVGATYPEELIQVRKIVGNMQILVPGLGSQGGKPEDIARAFDSNKRGIIGNVARTVIFAKTQEGETFAQASRREAIKWKDAINVHR
jgi:orotidine-5'-phosphate decarboxylase